MTISLMNYKDIIAEYHSGSLSPRDTVEIVQFLLDTDLIRDYPELYELADRFVMEGLCYQVPIVQLHPKDPAQDDLAGFCCII